MPQDVQMTVDAGTLNLTSTVTTTEISAETADVSQQVEVDVPQLDATVISEAV